LEHSRIYRFGEGERARIFIGSGDLMTRNTVRRIELFAPVADKDRKQEISDLLNLILLDNENAREMTAEGLYAAVPRVGDPLDSQQYLIEQAKRAADSPPIDRRAGEGPARRIADVLRAVFLRHR
jgi:polyphosphate kinase